MYPHKAKSKQQIQNFGEVLRGKQEGTELEITFLRRRCNAKFVKRKRNYNNDMAIEKE
jgi:hypothetical protein